MVDDVCEPMKDEESLALWDSACVVLLPDFYAHAFMVIALSLPLQVDYDEDLVIYVLELYVSLSSISKII